MRWIFLFMLTLNFAYLGWELTRPEARPLALTENRDAVASLVLLRELESAVSPASPVAAVPSAEALEQTAVVEVSSSPTEDEAAGEAIAEASPKAEPSISLAPQPALAEQTASCYSLGPFRELADLRKLIRNIRDFVAEASFRSSEEREQTMYWVYLPPQSSLQAANALADELKLKNIRDYYVLSGGERANAISLGHFREKDRALSLMNKAKQAGFAAQMEPVFKNYNIYWLDYQVQPGRTIPTSALNMSAMPSVTRFDRSCE